MTRFKLLSFFVHGKKQERWYDFKLHRFVKKPQTMWRLSFALNYIPIHNKYRSYLFQVFSDDREWLEENRDLFFERFIVKVGEDLESLPYAEENAVLGIEDIVEVEWNPDLIGETYFAVERHETKVKHD